MIKTRRRLLVGARTPLLCLGGTRSGRGTICTLHRFVLRATLVPGTGQLPVLMGLRSAQGQCVAVSATASCRGTFV